MGGSFSAFKFGILGITKATTKQIYNDHFKENTGTFEEFHIAYVDFCKYFNTVMPGQDFKTPSYKDIKEFYDDVWSKQSNEAKKCDEFFNFVKRSVREDPRDDKFFIMTGLAAPAAAVIGKRASQHIPYVKSVRLDLVPNVVFVPVFTLGALIVATAAQMNWKRADTPDKHETADQNKGESKKD